MAEFVLLFRRYYYARYVDDSGVVIGWYCGNGSEVSTTWKGCLGHLYLWAMAICLISYLVGLVFLFEKKYSKSMAYGGGILFWEIMQVIIYDFIPFIRPYTLF
jgi:hypothetical protein